MFVSGGILPSIKLLNINELEELVVRICIMCVDWGGLCKLAECVVDGAGDDVMTMLDVWTGV